MSLPKKCGMCLLGILIGLVEGVGIRNAYGVIGTSPGRVVVVTPLLPTGAPVNRVSQVEFLRSADDPGRMTVAIHYHNFDRRDYPRLLFQLLGSRFLNFFEDEMLHSENQAEGRFENQPDGPSILPQIRLVGPYLADFFDFVQILEATLLILGRDTPAELVRALNELEPPRPTEAEPQSAAASSIVEQPEVVEVLPDDRQNNERHRIMALQRVSRRIFTERRNSATSNSSSDSMNRVTQFCPTVDVRVMEPSRSSLSTND